MRNLSKLTNKKGVAGLEIFLALIVTLFIIGLVVMIFSLMGGELQKATYTTTSATSTNESLANANASGITLTVGNSANLGVCGSVTAMYNASHTSIALANISQDGCVVYNSSVTPSFYGTTWKYTYPYTYGQNNTATETMYDTTTGLSGATDWFDIFLVIGAMVVLILLVVIIIVAIRGTGITGGGMETGGVGNIGSG